MRDGGRRVSMCVLREKKDRVRDQPNEPREREREGERAREGENLRQQDSQEPSRLPRLFRSDSATTYHVPRGVVPGRGDGAAAAQCAGVRGGRASAAVYRMSNRHSERHGLRPQRHTVGRGERGEGKGAAASCKLEF